ncbi:MAG: CBS domain-containing protein [Candidatus Omnitrophota bacterium]
MAIISIGNIMSEDIVSIHKDAMVGQAAHILLRFRINGILVISKTNKNKILGVFTTTDLLRYLEKTLSQPGRRAAELARIARLPVTALMKKEVISVSINDRFGKLLALIHRKGIHTVPVYDGDKLVGVVGRHDVLNAAFRI